MPEMDRTILLMRVLDDMPYEEIAAALDAWGEYVHLNRKCDLLKKSWYAVAVVPFVILIFVNLRFSPNSTNRIWDFLIAISLLWGLRLQDTQ